MPPLRGAKINSGFLLVRRRFDLLLFRGAQLIATMHTYFCSRPKKIAAATFTHPPTNPPRLLFFHYVCAGPRALCPLPATTCPYNTFRPTLTTATHLPSAYSARPFSLLLVLLFPFLLQFSLSLCRSAFIAGKTGRNCGGPVFPKSRLPKPRNHVLLRVIYSYYLFLPALSSLRYYTHGS